MAKALHALKAFVLALFLIHNSIHTHSIDFISATVHKETIQGVTFMHRFETVNGLTKNVWTINGLAVTQEEFDEEILNAEKNMRRVEREKARENMMREQILKEKVMHQGYAKLLKKSIEEVEQVLQRIDVLNLDQFLFFTPKTFSDREQFSAVREQVLTQAYSALHEINEHFEKEKIQALLQKLDESSEHLRTLIHDSIEHAISHCDDTKTLKELLATAERM